MKTPHKHAALIKAWADGAKIEIRTVSGKWVGYEDRDCPTWHELYEYRIKPEDRKPDIVVSRWVYKDGSTSHCSQSNVRYTFDGETGKLKSAEVL